MMDTKNLTAVWLIIQLLPWAPSWVYLLSFVLYLDYQLFEPGTKLLSCAYTTPGIIGLGTQIGVYRCYSISNKQ